MKTKIKICIVRALHACDGVPMPESALEANVAVMMRPAEPTASDFRAALKEAEAEGYAQGVSDSLTGRSWTLTEKGTHRARNL